MLNLKIIIGVTSLTLFLIILELIRRDKLKERYALLWLFISLATFLFSFTPRVIGFLSRITGMYYLSIISFAAFMFVLAILLHFSIVISMMHDRIKTLTQKLALLEQAVSQSEGKPRGT